MTGTSPTTSRAHPDTLHRLPVRRSDAAGLGARDCDDGHEELGLRGIKLLPMYAGFRPDDERLDPLWKYADAAPPAGAAAHRHDVRRAGAARMHAAAARSTPSRSGFPDVKIIMAHLGHPYEGECVATIRKHPNVYADVSALHYRPFQLYHSLMLVQEYGVWDKVLFGTDYPFTTVNATSTGSAG